MFLLQSHFLLCQHGFCDVSVTLWNVSVALTKQILDVHPWSDSTEFRGIGRGSSSRIYMYLDNAGDYVTLTL